MKFFEVLDRAVRSVSQPPIFMPQSAVIILTLLLIFTLPNFALAGNEGYFVGYNHRIHEGEIELMLMNDFTWPSKFKKRKGQHAYLSHMLEFEYGVTNQFAIEPMLEWWEESSTNRAEFTRGRTEMRFRIFEDEKFINPMIYAEFEFLKKTTRYKMEVSGWIDSPYTEAEEAEPDYERILETRLILSKDIGNLNIAFNWINETDVHAGGTAFGYSLGLMYHPSHTSKEDCTCKTSMPDCKCAHCRGEPLKCQCHMEGHGGIMYGLELFGGLGDSKDSGLTPSRQEHYLQPILGFSLDSRTMVHLGPAIGLSNASDNLFRVAIGIEF